MDDDELALTPDMLLQAYRVGVFPMSEGRDDPEIFWVDPRLRGIMPLDKFKISRSLAKTMRRGHLRVTFDTAFDDVVRGCADRDETWINDTIFELYHALFLRGDAHSVEVWHDDRLVGGAYGVTAGSAFFGESMFSRVTDASKVALAYLIDRLSTCGFTLFDTQFLTEHLASLGAVEVQRSKYHELLKTALKRRAAFDLENEAPSAQDVIQRNAQTS